MTDAPSTSTIFAVSLLAQFEAIIRHQGEDSFDEVELHVLGDTVTSCRRACYGSSP